MEKFTWDDKYSVGVQKFDDEHKILFGMINKLFDSGNTQEDSETVTDLITEMTDYFHHHFRTEEQCMRENGYPGYSEQCTEHSKFVERVLDFCDADLSQPEKIKKDMAIYLRDWLTNHVLVTDMKYKSFFNEKGLI